MQQSKIDAANDWLESVTKAASQPRVMATGPGLRAALGGSTPGGWASDHRAEANQYTGWNYVAVRAIAIQGMQAGVAVYDSAKKVETTKARLKSSYNEDADKGQPVDENDPLLKLLRKPNSLRYVVDGREVVRKNPGALFRCQQLIQLNLTGKCLIWNVPNALGKTVERYVVPTAIAEAQPACREFPNGWWRVKPELARSFVENGWFNGSIGLIIGHPIPAERIQVVLWPHATYSDDGQSPLAAGALWTDLANKIDKSRWNAMDNGVDPSLAIQLPEGYEGDEADLDRASAKFNQKYAGVGNKKKAMFTNGKVTKLSATPDEMDYGPGFEQMRDAILALHGTPGTAAGVTQATGREGLYAPLLQWSILTVQPQLSMLAEADTAWLSPEFGETLTVEYLAKSVNDPAERENELKTDLSGRIRKRDEIRLLRGLEPLGGELGEELVGGNLLAGSQPMLGEVQPQPQQQQPIRQLPAKQPLAEQPKPAVAAEDVNTNKEIALNGAQITAAVQVLSDVRSGSLAADAGVELLVAVGIDRDKAKLMIRLQTQLPEPEAEPLDVQPAGFAPKSNGHHSNGHAKRFAFNEYP